MRFIKFSPVIYIFKAIFIKTVADLKIYEQFSSCVAVGKIS